MSAPTVAGLLDTDRTVISNVEAGRFGISENRLRRLAEIYRCEDQDLIDALAAMTGGRVRGWWDEYREKIPQDLLDVSELESFAVRLRTVQTAHLPGLFQTEEHARALFNLFDPPLSRLDVELRVAHRLARRDVVVKGGLPYLGLVHEAALRMRIGGRDVAKRQIAHLLESSERDNVALLVVPFTAGEFPLLGDSVLYAEGPTPQLDTVHTDSATGACFIDAPDALANFRRKLDVIEKLALPPARSRDLMHLVERDM